MTTESEKPSEILRPLYEATWPYPTKEFTAYSDARYAIDDSHHSRLTALEAAMATEGGFLPSTRPVGEAGQSSESTPLPTPECYPVIHQIGYSRCPACAHLETTSRSVEEGAREFYCKRHAGTRPGDVSDWLVNDLTTFANQRTAAVEKERDEWKARFEKLEARWNTDHAAVYAKLSTVRSERDAAMAKVAELEKVLAEVKGVVK